MRFIFLSNRFQSWNVDFFQLDLFIFNPEGILDANPLLKAAGVKRVRRDKGDFVPFVYFAIPCDPPHLRERQSTDRVQTA